AFPGTNSTISCLRTEGAFMEKSLDDLRDRVRQLDAEIITLAAERMELTRHIGEVKRRENLATIDYAQERIVLDRARAVAKERGLDPSVAEDVFASLIRAAVMVQDEDSLRVAAAGAGQTAVIVG